jgi:hypothetical protein
MHHIFTTLICLLFAMSAASADTLRFTYSDGDPPLSYVEEGVPAGMFPDLVALVLGYISEYEVSGESLPWPRAQLYVEQGERDGFMTYPSEKRQAYALFSEEPVYVQDYGYLVYDKNNPQRESLENSKSFQDLVQLSVVLEIGSDWEKENIPSFLKSVKAPNHDSAIHLLYLRKSVDFIVMPPEIAKHIANKYGYQDMVAFTSVDYINDSRIPFHIGISKANKHAEAIMELVNKVLRRKDFQEQRQVLIDSYR